MGKHQRHPRVATSTNISAAAAASSRDDLTDVCVRTRGGIDAPSLCLWPAQPLPRSPQPRHLMAARGGPAIGGQCENLWSRIVADGNGLKRDDIAL
jgi:hypothetical protein